MIMSVNAGSSSLKMSLYSREESQQLSMLAEARWERDAGKFVFKVNYQKYEEESSHSQHSAAFKHVLDFWKGSSIIKDYNDIKIVANRAVNGGRLFDGPTLINSKVLEQFASIQSLAPLHNPINLQCATLALDVLPNASHYFVFDTAFHATIPLVNKIYALPYECYEDGIQVYGAHGISHEDMTNRVAELLGIPKNELNVITCHLGNGSSISCVHNGACIDTSMGMTPLDGLTMGTRCGRLDAGAYPRLVKKYKNVQNVDNLLNKSSGLLGISGISSDMRVLLKLRSEGNLRASLAIEKFVQEVRKVIGEYLLELEYDVDAIVFSGGIGENNIELVRAITSKMEKVGVILSREPEKLTISNSKVKVFQLKADEELAMAKKVLACYLSKS